MWTSTLLLLPLKLRSGADLLLFGVLSTCGFNAELYLLLPEHRGEICPEWIGSLGCGAGGDDVGGAGGDVADVLARAFGRLRFLRRCLCVRGKFWLCCWGSDG